MLNQPPMIIKEAKFVVSNTKVEKCPEPSLPEYAFIGRSNVGKSSLINLLTNRKSLARISKTPGKTQLINHFLINNNWYLVDLPGYGFAKVPVGKKKEWDQMIKKYILSRTNLICLFVLVDSRLEPQKNDIHFMKFLGNNQVPFAIIYTKTDKLKKSELTRNLEIYKKEMLKSWESLPPVFEVSAVTRKGRMEILEYIQELNQRLVHKK